MIIFTSHYLSTITLYDTVYFKVNNCFYFIENVVKMSSIFFIYFLKIFSLSVYSLRVIEKRQEIVTLCFKTFNDLR